VTGLAQRRWRLATPTTAAILGVLSVLLVLAASPLEVLDPGSLSVNSASDPASVVLSVVFMLAFAAVGVVVARREPQNPVGGCCSRSRWSGRSGTSLAPIPTRTT
jgi:hypothetical protein